MRKYLSMMFVLMLAATIGLSACAKKEEPPPPPPPPPAGRRARRQHGSGRARRTCGSG